MRLSALVREAVASARSQPVASVLTLFLTAAMVLAVMLTTGRTVGAEQRVMGSLDDLGTRSIIVRADDGAGVTSSVLARLAPLEGIQWAAAFTTAVDATNAAVPDGTRVATRLVYGDALELLGIPEHPPVPGGLAYASDAALDLLGLPDAAGGITLTTGASFGVAGRLRTPDFLARFEPLVLVPQHQPSGAEPVNIIVVIAQSPELVASVADVTLSVLGADDPTKVTVETSETLAQLRSIIQGQLGTFSRGLVLALLVVTGALVAVILYGLVVLRRKDYGRRRALGAGRALIVSLLLVQTALLAVVGVTVGVGVSVVVLLVTGDPLPGAPFVAALAVLTLVTALIAASVPAFVASRREPIRELRVP